ncbi:MAG: phosphate signaling complex protein PhoU [Chitinispirillaceae bacterium]|nr:phosphate signaling complex protein PhoU [Chitinispirillaceae bacterium]
MYLQHEESVNRDINRIRERIIEMAQCTETSLRDIITTCIEHNHTLAYGIILRDQYIDEKEKEIDRLCLEFIVKQQPVAQPLRFAFSAIKLNMEIERVGDYAESMARHLLKFGDWPSDEVRNLIIELAETAISMFHDAIQSFTEESIELARKTLATEDNVDKLRDQCINFLLSTPPNNIPLLSLLNVVRRFERVADQAQNICMEVLYMLTGEYLKHPGSEAYRVLFVDEHNSIRSRIAESVANGLNMDRFIFSSAGVDPKPINQRTIDFLKEKGFDISKNAPRALAQIPNLDYYHIVVVFASEAKGIFPRQPRKTIFLDWEIDVPSLSKDNDETIAAGYENMFTFIKTHVTNLVNAIAAGTTTDRRNS